jgi:hypothetical protein
MATLFFYFSQLFLRNLNKFKQFHSQIEYFGPPCKQELYDTYLRRSIRTMLTDDGSIHFTWTGKGKGAKVAIEHFLTIRCIVGKELSLNFYRSVNLLVVFSLLLS